MGLYIKEWSPEERWCRWWKLPSVATWMSAPSRGGRLKELPPKNAGQHCTSNGAQDSRTQIGKKGSEMGFSKNGGWSGRSDGIGSGMWTPLIHWQHANRIESIHRSNSTWRMLNNCITLPRLRWNGSCTGLPCSIVSLMETYVTDTLPLCSSFRILCEYSEN